MTGNRTFCSLNYNGNSYSFPYRGLISKAVKSLNYVLSEKFLFLYVMREIDRDRVKFEE